MTLPVSLPGIRFGGRGARMLPIGIGLGDGRRLRHATAELVERRAAPDGSVQLGFAAVVGEPFEVALDGRIGTVNVAGGRWLEEPHEQDGATILVIEATAPEVTLRFPPS